MLESFNGNTETILLLGIAVFVVFSLLGLVLWNAKTNKQVKALTSIDDSLKHLEFSEPSVPQTKDETEASEPMDESPAEAVAEEAETIDPEPELPEETATARSGRVYTRQELETLIRD